MNILTTPIHGTGTNDKPQSPTGITQSALLLPFFQQTIDERRAVLQQLASSPVAIALDTEFEGGHTLTIQAAARLGRQLVVQVYHSPAIPTVPANFQTSIYLPRTAGGYGKFFDDLKMQPDKPIHSTLSPVDLVNDLFAIQPPLTPVDRERLKRVRRHELTGDTDPEAVGVVALPLDLELIAHFWPADFLRVFGREFYFKLLQRPTASSPIELFDGKVMRFIVKHSGFADYQPAVQFAQDFDGTLYRVTLKFRDTHRLFGPGSLDAHSRTFLQFGKSDSLTTEDKLAMRETFRRKPHDAYGYAIVDAVNTLLVHEQMAHTNQEMYRRFGHAGHVEMASTSGRRVADFLITMIEAGPAKHSQGLATASKLKQLMAKGGSKTFVVDQRASRYGETTGTVHGGLGYSRSSSQFAHLATGRLRDVDMSGCYTSILSRQNVYFGRPVIFDPGDRKLSLKAAVNLVQMNCEPDAWFLRATGDISNFRNTLIPSTDGARTSDNYKRRTLQPVGTARLYSGRIESGIVTSATWRIIQALPAAARHEYEALNVDTIVMYPRQFVARGGRVFDQLVEERRAQDLPWESILDLERKKIHHEETLDEEYVCLQFPIGKIARALAKSRREVQKQIGKGTGMDAAYKLQANTLYGVLASDYLPTQNVVAANHITATARAAAYAMTMALNAIQVITDGCTFRTDRVPACTFADCLQLQSDYPLRRADENLGIPFIDPNDIPDAEAEFNRWYLRHVKRFFDVGNEYDDLLGLHRLVFKCAGPANSVSFDALLCDGAGNYLKALLNPVNELEPVATAFRGYRHKSVAELTPWLLRSYTEDRFTDPPPLIVEQSLMKLQEAKQTARSALRLGVEPVVLPLGFPVDKVRSYQVIKPSAFIFQNPIQRRNFERQLQRFKHRTGCGLEVLALRRNYRDRRTHSLVDLARMIFETIQDGKMDFSKELHSNREFEGLKEVVEQRHSELNRLRQEAIRKTMDNLRLEHLPTEDPALLTGCHCYQGDPLLE